MTLSRKQFFKKAVSSLAEAASTISSALSAPAPAGPFASVEPCEPVEGDLVASACNEHCLAGASGCYTCLEHCDANAIHLVLGTGIGIDETRCSGCGTCRDVCPVTPRGVRMRNRDKASGLTAETPNS